MGQQAGREGIGRARWVTPFVTQVPVCRVLWWHRPEGPRQSLSQRSLCSRVRAAPAEASALVLSPAPGSLALHCGPASGDAPGPWVLCWLQHHVSTPVSSEALAEGRGPSW